MTDEKSSNELEDAKQRLESFLKDFLGEANDAGKYDRIRDDLKQIRPQDDLMVLPRFDLSTDDASYYVITRRSVTVQHAQELITAFAGPSYAMAGDRIPYRLDLADPIDAAVHDFLREDTSATVFRITTGSVNEDQRKALRSALETMRDVVKKSPSRAWTMSKPLSRLITDFDAALAVGGSTTSQEIFQQIVRRGGIDATNLTHLRIKRLDRLGLSEELLGMRELPNVLVQNPPRPIKEAVLNAVYTIKVAAPLETGEVSTAVANLEGVALPLPVFEDVDHYGPSAVAVMIAAAVGREDGPRLADLLSRLEAFPGARTKPSDLPTDLLNAARSLASPEEEQPLGPEKGDPETSDASELHVNSWMDFFTIASPEQVTAVRKNEEWREWSPIGESDRAIADFLKQLDDAAWEDAWSRVGVVLQSLDFDSSIPRIAREFINYALSSDKFSHVDLLTLQAFVDAFLRTGPAEAAYQNLLQEVLDTTRQWASTEHADLTLDFADLLVRMPCPNTSARTNLGYSLLDPLRRHQTRLTPSTHSFAQRLSQELGLSLDWKISSPLPEETGQDFSRLTVLLYSLDERVLHRVQEELQRQFQGLKIHVSHDKVGSPSLKAKARNSDVIALAVRCAKHAATGFIYENARSKEGIFYANGSGSASLLSAVLCGLPRQ